MPLRRTKISITFTYNLSLRLMRKNKPKSLKILKILITMVNLLKKVLKMKTV